MEHNLTRHKIKQREAAERYKDSIRGCLLGGAAGDALGYPVEFFSVSEIFSVYGTQGITEYALNRRIHKALISDDTQMTLFTANGMLFGGTRRKLQGTAATYSTYIARAYKDWFMTQTTPFKDRPTDPQDRRAYISWLCDVPNLYSRRAPGNTCLSALRDSDSISRSNYFSPPVNHSKGCGGVMRVAPLSLVKWDCMDTLLHESAQAAAITHGHPLGYMPASVLCYIIQRLVFYKATAIDLKQIVYDAKIAVCDFFKNGLYTDSLAQIIDYAVELSENDEPDIENIHRLGGGWVAEEALAISIYCSLRYQNDFSSGIIAAVNHDGDSDSTGAITGNILGALIGYGAIRNPWESDLELVDVILEIADDLCYGCPTDESGKCTDCNWERKYLHAKYQSD